MPQDNQSQMSEDNTPYNLDAEQSVLAAMMLDRDVAEEAVATLSSDDFFKAAHRTIFLAMHELVEQRTPVDQLTLADKLDAMGKLKEVGGQEYIISLGDKTYALANWVSHLEIIQNDSLLRDLIRATIKIKALSESSTDDAAAVVEEAEKMLFDATQKRVENSFKPLGELVVETMDVLDKISANKDMLIGVPTGFKDLDNTLGGLKAGDLVILAARTSIGKTALALNISLNAAKAGTTVAFFSLEMPSQQVVQRLLSSEANINSWRMNQGLLETADFQHLVQAQNNLGDLKFYIDDSSGLTIMELRAKARRLLKGVKDTDNKGLIVIDYLQLMDPSRSSGRVQQRYEEVGGISRGLKALAKDLGVPILALAQLSRVVDTRDNKRPQLSDLRESGSIEQDADVVLFLDRSRNAEEAEKKDRPEMGTAKIYIGKNRNGPLRTIETVFIEDVITFRDKYKG